MPELKREVHSFMVEYACDECSQKPNPGCILRLTGSIAMTYPEKYEYECPSCKKRISLPHVYPRIAYFEFEGDGPNEWVER